MENAAQIFFTGQMSLLSPNKQSQSTDPNRISTRHLTEDAVIPLSHLSDISYY